MLVGSRLVLSVSNSLGVIWQKMIPDCAAEVSLKPVFTFPGKNH